LGKFLIFWKILHLWWVYSWNRYKSAFYQIYFSWFHEWCSPDSCSHDSCSPTTLAPQILALWLHLSSSYAFFVDKFKIIFKDLKLVIS
jgi:hypothetical protein